jgi:hypothetical protein
MPARSSKPRTQGPPDPNVTAFRILGEATGESPKTDPETSPLAGKNPAAVALGRLGGAKGGAARAAKLSAKKRKSIARRAAIARWHKT